MLRPYLELMRPPNVATSIGDVLAGFAVAGLANGRVLPWLLAASACLYAGGVVLNDVFDRGVDAVERPERPLPSGRVPAGRAAALGTGLLLLGVLAARMANGVAGVVGLCLAGAVVAYDGWSKRNRWIGPANMGLCRALNLGLGMAATPAALAAEWPLGLVPFAYISGITVLSRGEVSGGDRRAAGLALLLVAAALAAVTGVVLLRGSGPGVLAGLCLAALLAWRVLPSIAVARQSPGPAPLRAAVRRGVLSLVLLDAAIAAAFAGPAYSLVLLAAALAAGWLARSFAVT